MSTIVRVSSIEGVCCIVNMLETESSVHYIYSECPMLRASLKRELTACMLVDGITMQLSQMIFLPSVLDSVSEWLVRVCPCLTTRGAEETSLWSTTSLSHALSSLHRNHSSSEHWPDSSRLLSLHINYTYTHAVFIFVTLLMCIRV